VPARFSKVVDLRAASREPILRLALITAAVFTIVNAAIYAFQEPWSGAFRATVRSVPAVFLVVLLAALSGPIWMVLIPVFFATTGTILYFAYYYRIPLTSNLIALVVETTPDEANGLVGWRLVAWIGAFVVLGIVAAFIRRRLRWTNRGLPVIAVTLAALCTLVLRPSEYLAMPQPIGLLQQLVIYRREYTQRQRFMQRLVDATSGMTARGDIDVTVVFVLGESARWDHFAINGYLRPTTPHLIADSVTSFRDVTACAVITRNSIPCMLRGVSPPPAPEIERTSLVSVFRAAGFKTSWISNQGLGGGQSAPLAPLAMESELRVFTPKGQVGLEAELLDGNLLPSIDHALAERGKNFVLVHTIGSHWNYQFHDPPQFKSWMPECTEETPSRCDRAALVNAYDNTILYTDHVLHEIIERLRGRNALFVFIADHGEGLGDPGFLHGHAKGRWNGPPEELKVPLFVWASPEWKSRHAERFQAIERASQISTTYETIFHSLIHCSGIVISALELTKSFCASATP
jgi:glucan phosphoethanolaminetransferase (alkaline phosphatase superfamily)